MFRRQSLFIAAAIALVMGFGTFDVLADGVPGTVSTDPFDSTNGTVIVDHDTIVDPINAFRITGGFEEGNTLMRNGGLNSVSFINFDTATPVSIVGVRLFASEEYWGPYLGFRRAMNHFKLFADTNGDATFETVVVDVPINVNYSTQPGNVAVQFGHLDLTISSALVTAQHWRLEVTQGSNLQPYEGARLVEVDAIPAPDTDGDGVLDAYDACANTAAGSVVNATGCSIAQLCPCGSTWKNHGSYVSCVAQTAEEFAMAGLITWAEKDIVVSTAARSECGGKN